jgi:hypothetical protein
MTGRHHTGETGIALIIVLLIMLVSSALGMSLALMTMTEGRVTATYRDGMEVLYAADAALERVMPDLAKAPDVNQSLAGLTPSSFVDGPPGPRRLPDDTFVDLHTLTATVTCGRPVCSDVELDAVTEERPWGRNNPRWRLFGYGHIPDTGDGHQSRAYAVVWIADDPAEVDSDPLIDGGAGETEANPGRGRLMLLAHGYGAGRTRRVIEATVSKTESGFHVIAWREVR